MIKEIYLAGGCFWGTQKYFSLIKGVVDTSVGYANGNTVNPTYEDICNKNTSHAETVKILYDDQTITLQFILQMYYDIIDPTSVNRQGADVGIQYRTGIYYINEIDKDIILDSIMCLQQKLNKKIAIEVKPLENYYCAENYHQNYLNNNPKGYCHISINKFEKAKNAVDKNFNK